MDSWKSMIIVIVIIAIGSFSLLNFVFLMEVANNQNVTILSEGSPLNAFNSSISSNLNTFQSSAVNYKNATEQEQNTLTEPTGALALGSIFTSGIRFSSFIMGAFTSILNILSFIGVPIMILTALISLLIVVIALLWWRLVKWGQ